jgi:hypothetical protein
MSRPKAAQRAAAANVTATLAALLSPARAEASRKNGARSRGPKTAEGKARASRNALKHGLCASRHVIVDGESPEEFAAFEAALVADLAPAGALQMLLAGRIARAAWRLERAERIEAELFARKMDGPFGDGDLGLALIRDGNGARAFETLLRYRGAAQAELTRTLRTLKALQAEAPARASTADRPNQPEARGNPGESACTPSPERPAALAPILAPTPRVADRLPEKQPDEPEGRKNPRDSGRSPSFPSQTARPNGSASLLAGTALVPIGRRRN